ncbi:MAG: hypothetical protein H7Z43_06570 [Clostridia bacterium]|nr:hypothetical protein [Deltaproteobacteria bacterium]
MIVAWSWLAFVAAVTGVAALRRVRHRVVWKTEEDHLPRVLVLRPCTGSDAYLAKSLATWPQNEANAAVRFLVPAKTDPVFECADRAASELCRNGIDAEVLITGMVEGAANRKVAQLAAADLEHFDIVCVLDADLDIRAIELAWLTAPLVGATAATWLPATEHATATLGDRASTAVLAGSLHAFPLLAGLDPRGLVGKAFGVRCDALRVVGGFASFATRLGEDVELAHRLIIAGYAVQPAQGYVASSARGRSFGATVDRFARWLTVIRAQRPMLLVSYPILFFATLPLLVWFAALQSLSGIVATLGVRALTALTASRFSGASASTIGDALLADVVLFCAWIKALSSRRVAWRGASFRIDARGHLVDG